MHPKAEIRPSSEAIQRILEKGWIGQLKIHGHRAQIHLSADPKDPILAFNRHGQLHKKAMPAAIAKELRRVFAPEKGWNVLDTEWLKPLDRIYVFDFVQKEDKSLHRLNFMERWTLLPKDFLSPHLQILMCLTTLPQCLKALARTEDFIEGLVFKSPSPGFGDSSIVRCRKPEHRGTRE